MSRNDPNIDPWLANLLPVPQSWDGWQGTRMSAVLFLILTSKHNPPKLVLTKRSRTVSTHKGQIGLPGGHRETYDRSPVDTALREAHEEIAANTDVIDVVGQFKTETSLQGHAVVPILGLSSEDQQDFKASTDEVAKIIQVPLHQLTQDFCETISFSLFRIQRTSSLYRYETHLIWGLTAKIISSIAPPTDS